MPKLFDYKEEIEHEYFESETTGKRWDAETTITYCWTCKDRWGVIKEGDRTKDSMRHIIGASMTYVSIDSLPDLDPEERIEKCLRDGQQLAWYEVHRHEGWEWS